MGVPEITPDGDSFRPLGRIPSERPLERRVAPRRRQCGVVPDAGPTGRQGGRGDVQPDPTRQTAPVRSVSGGSELPLRVMVMQAGVVPTAAV